MTNFVEVMRQRKKMCDKYLVATNRICSDCPLHTRNNGIYKTCTDLIFENPETALEIINKWTERQVKHIKFRNPTWREWWISSFPDDSICPTMCLIENPFNYDESYCNNITCDECANKVIPDEIVKKFDIKQIEVEDDTDD